MNTQYIYTLDLLRPKVLTEGCDLVLTRIEISYIAESEQASNYIYSNSFAANAKKDIEGFEQILNETSGICYKVPLIQLLDVFQIELKFN